MQLPVMGSVEETIRVLQYLSKRVSGATIEEMRSVLDKKCLDGRKINAYIVWGFVIRESEKLKATDRGKKLLECHIRGDENGVIEVFKEVIFGIPEYYSVVEKMYYSSDMSEITNVFVAENWAENKKYGMSGDAESTLKDRAVCFFKICEAAGIGKFCLGRRGLMTRLEIDREVLSQLIEEHHDDLHNENVPVDKVLEGAESRSIVPLTDNESRAFSDVNGETQESRGTAPLVIPFVDGRKATLVMPENVTAEDADYILAMIRMMMKSQYGLKD